MDRREVHPRASVDTLDVAASRGVWAVRSASPTVYYIDLDRGRLMRVWGEGSQRFAFDDEWLPLVEVTSHDESLRPVRNGELRVGERARYLTDPRGGVGAYEWRVQRTVTAIEPVDDEQAAALGASAADDSGPDGEELDGRR